MPGLSTNRSLPALACVPWDILVVGGGITGAGIFFEAACRGLRVLLVEQNDFASGTSSRSSKLVHGGLHYLKRLQIGLAHGAIRSREHMVSTMEGLVEEADFLLPTFTDDRMPPSWQISCLLSAYDLLAGRIRVHRRRKLDTAGLRHSGFTPLLSGAFTFTDATTDDARLVLHVLREGCRRGGHALNYVAASELSRDHNGHVIGATLTDGETGSTAEVRARAVISATGPWADRLRSRLGRPPRVRLIRGSHLVFPRHKLPIRQAIATLHPVSGGPIYFIPWEGVTLVGSTSEDHTDSLDAEPRITSREASYLLESVNDLFPSMRAGRDDIQATYAGVRPVVDTGTADPSQASREEAIWFEDGMLTVTGGKLTTFLSTARRVLRTLRGRLPELAGDAVGTLVMDVAGRLPADIAIDVGVARTVWARHGVDGLAALVEAPPRERASIPGLSTCWAELRWIAQSEAIQHLDDLLLRRLRIGLTAREGGIPWLGRMRPILQAELGWSDARWTTETDRYRNIWQKYYGVPEFEASRTESVANPKG